MNSWKVLCTQSRNEFKVEEQLSRLGIESYLPKIKMIRQWSDRKKIITTAAFPGYIFVLTDHLHRNDVFYAKGAKRYLRTDNHDAMLSDKEIEMIRIAESSISHPQVLTSIMTKGNSVKIIEGPLFGYCGELIEFMGNHKIALYIKELALGFFIEIPISHVTLI